MASFGWHRVDGKINLPKSAIAGFDFFVDPRSRHKKVHVSVAGEEVSLCNNAVYNDDCTIADPQSKSQMKNMCRNCGRVLLSMQDEEGNNNDVVKRAKKTLSRPEISMKHKRLEAHKKALSKTRDDFTRAMEKTSKSTIKLPDEISSEHSSLSELLSMSATVLTTIRRSANLNLDRVMHEWKKLPPNSDQEFTLVQQAQHLKQLISAVDQIKSFPKQT